MARKISEAIIDAGLDVKLFDIAQSERTEVIGEMLEAKAFLIGSSTHDNDMLTSVAGFLEFLKGLKPKNRVAAAFGSYGWSGGAVAEIGPAARSQVATAASQSESASQAVARLPRVARSVAAAQKAGSK